MTEHPNEQWPKQTNTFFILFKSKEKNVWQLEVKGHYGNSIKSSGTQGFRLFQVQAAKPRPLFGMDPDGLNSSYQV